MSVLAEAISVVIPIRVIEGKYPGGLKRYGLDDPNKTYCSDEYLTRIGFMVPADVHAFIEHLSAFGFIHVTDRRAVDLSVVDQLQGSTVPCDWLEGGKHPDGYSAVWLAGTVPGYLAHPVGWTPEQSRMMKFSPNAEVGARFLHLGMHGRSDVLLDYQTGSQMYVGRVRSRPQDQ